MNFLKALKSMFSPTPRATPAGAADRLRSGRAVLVDVRQPSEWQRGVAEGAVLLPLTDLLGAREQWKSFLAQVGDRELLCYCAAGGRSAIAARVLAGEGFRTANAGAIVDWANAGWPIVSPDERSG